MCPWKVAHREDNKPRVLSQPARRPDDKASLVAHQGSLSLKDPGEYVLPKMRYFGLPEEPGHVPELIFTSKPNPAQRNPIHKRQLPKDSQPRDWIPAAANKYWWKNPEWPPRPRSAYDPRQDEELAHVGFQGGHKSFLQGDLSWKSEIPHNPGQKSWLLDDNACEADPSAPYWKTVQYLAQCPELLSARFHDRSVDEVIKHKLMGPENWSVWEHGIQEAFTQRGMWALVADELLPVPPSSRFYSRWRILNDQAWSILLRNCSREIQNIICDLDEGPGAYLDEGPGASLAWNTLRTWCYLKQTYGSVAVRAAYSARGIKELFSFKHDPAQPVEVFVEKVMKWVQASECIRQDHADDEWTTCQFILGKLDSSWDTWVSKFMKKVECGNPGAIASIQSVELLRQDLKSEYSRRESQRVRGRAKQVGSKKLFKSLFRT